MDRAGAGLSRNRGKGPGRPLKIDREADALYLTLTEGPASRSEEVAPGIIVDYDEQGRLVGVEVLYLSQRAPEAELQRFLFETVPSER